MIASDKVTLFTITFAVAYAVVYVLCVELNLPVFTYHPAIGDIDLLKAPVKSGPAMYWYGWMLAALIGAATLGAVATALPERYLQRLIFAGVLGAIAYMVLYTSALFIYDRATVEIAWLESRWPSVSLAAVIGVLLGLFIPVRWSNRLWPGWTWVVPLGALSVLGYYLSPYFTQ
jgi:hypothetical protein